MDKLTQYIMALTNLYGMVHKEMVLDIYNGMNDEKVSLDRINRYFGNDLKQIPGTYAFTYGKYFVHEIVVEFENYVQFMRGKDEKPYYIPDEEKLLRFVEYSYQEKTAAYYRLCDYAHVHFYPNDKEWATEFTDQVLGGLVFGLTAENIMTVEFDRLNIELEDEMQKKVVNALIEDLNLDARTWKNNGYTERELATMNAGSGEAGFGLSGGRVEKGNVVKF